MLRLYFRSFGATLPPELTTDHCQPIEAIEKRVKRLAHKHTVPVCDRYLSSLGVRGLSVKTGPQV